ncbi:MAG: hypothetical protein ACI30I_12160 [Parabacteroides sp.]
MTIGHTTPMSGLPIVPETNQMRQATERFEEFEKKFVSDEQFQLSRIIFDDLGFVPDEDPEAEAVKWTPENWTMMKATLADVRKDKTYKTKLKVLANQCIETIWIEDSSFLLEYTYTKIDGKWYLTRRFERY